MKYSKEETQLLIESFAKGLTVPELCLMFEVPERSIIAKLSSLGLYTRKSYLTKQGEPPVKKEEYLQRIAELLGVSCDILESLEKANKSVLILIEASLRN